MLSISEYQQEQLNIKMLSSFNAKLEQAFAALGYPSHDFPLKNVRPTIDSLVDEAIAKGIEFEIDIAMFCALKIGDIFNTIKEKSADAMTSPQDEEVIFPEEDNLAWMDKILDDIETTGDEKMTIICHRWLFKIERNANLHPTSEDIAYLETIF